MASVPALEIADQAEKIADIAPVIIAISELLRPSVEIRITAVTESELILARAKCSSKQQEKLIDGLINALRASKPRTDGPLKVEVINAKDLTPPPQKKRMSVLRDTDGKLTGAVVRTA